jgi:hypothetical protein
VEVRAAFLHLTLRRALFGIRALGNDPTEEV